MINPAEVGYPRPIGQNKGEKGPIDPPEAHECGPYLGMACPVCARQAKAHQDTLAETLAPNRFDPYDALDEIEGIFHSPTTSGWRDRGAEIVYALRAYITGMER